MTVGEGRDGWLALVAQADRQYGLVTRQQADAALTRNEFDGYVRRNVLVPAARGVWRMSGAPRTWRGRVMTACLSIGRPVAASHTTAARLWGIDGMPMAGLHLVVPRGRSGRSGRLGESLGGSGVVRHSAEFDELTVVERYGLPVTTTARTLVDLAAMLEPDRLFEVAEQLERDRHFDVEALRKERLVRPRLKGIRAIDQLIDRWHGGPVADSKWEDEVYGWLVGAGLPIPRRLHHVALGSGGLAIVDLAYPIEQVAIEFDGFKYHRGREQFDRDRVRLSELAADGWVPILVTASQSRDEVVDRVRRALMRKGWRPDAGGSGSVSASASGSVNTS
ncbi:MAG TPA: hypothetical protein VKV06_16565 [Acidimicrobiales bacterium]|nr:hypothetical protein [Acidimicrobiales bacterium]